MFFCGNNDNNGRFQYSAFVSVVLRIFEHDTFSKLGRCGRVNFHHSPGDLLVEPTCSNSSSLPGRKSGTSMARSAGDVLIVLGGGSQG